MDLADLIGDFELGTEVESSTNEEYKKLIPEMDEKIRDYFARNSISSEDLDVRYRN